MKIKSVGKIPVEDEAKINEFEQENKSELIHPLKKNSSSNLPKNPLVLSALVVLFGCLIYFLFINKNNKVDSSPDQKISESDSKRMELELKEKELAKREKELQSKNTPSGDNTASNNQINLLGSYWGSIKDGTKWYVNFTSFDGKNLSGYNVIYWKTTPEGFQTSFIGTYNSSNQEILMFEDKNAKGSGKFIGKVSNDGKTLSGNWYRYKDNGSFTWDLHKSN